MPQQTPAPSPEPVGGAGADGASRTDPTATAAQPVVPADQPPPPGSQPPPPAGPAAGDEAKCSSTGWKVATAMLAATTAATLFWGFSSAKTLQAQVDELNGQVTTQQQDAEAAAAVSETQIAELNAATEVLSLALKKLADQSEALLSEAATEYQALEDEVKQTQDALSELEKTQADTQATADQVESAYDKAKANLDKAKTALEDLLAALADEVAAAKDANAQDTDAQDADNQDAATDDDAGADDANQP